ncbi:helix-turn-helix domain-containing protein [Morganella morganii]|uniref:helix-turn-helix domain-containing protein n=1 Tax=Morganella morganii TaxID=582 RepID=UPI0011634A10|nr:helix-turn-helix transcriptional regulator [Morganella morganii]QQO72159.1 helix-turn-helix transcriptional regulator [Morganella morganii]
MITEDTDLTVNKSVGYRIFRKRKELGWSGSRLADHLGISQQQFSRYERGCSQINVSLLVRAADVLQTPVSWFFADCPEARSYRECFRGKADIYTAESVPEYGLSAPSRYKRKPDEGKQT